MSWSLSKRNPIGEKTRATLKFQEDNLRGLEQLNAQWVGRGAAWTPHRQVILDMDSPESSVYGGQEGAVYNGNFETVCYHPLFLFNEIDGIMPRFDDASQRPDHSWSSLSYT